MSNELILLVDDEPSIIQLARMYFERDGFRVLDAGDGEAALEAAAKHRPALIVLDVMLPKMDGFEVCRKLRAAENQTPILMLTARDEDIDKILGLELGADDYLTKPFNPRELVARVRAILRRSDGKLPTGGKPIHLGDLTIDPARREVRIQNRTLDLRTQEFDLLLTLAEHRGLVLSREQLLQLAWGFDFYGQTRTVDVHIAHLRKKIEGSMVKIETVTGVGYKLVASPSPLAPLPSGDGERG
ncbi:MAG: response regulator transcription factor [Chloroflexi bacterium]|nr:response regulator transcription factor [Chloroflexota bacterium]